MLRMIYLFLLVFILLTGCMKEAELTIHNDTPSLAKVSIDGIIYDLYEGESAKETYYLDSYLLFGDTEKIPVRYIQTTPYRTEKQFTVEMKPGKDKTYNVKFNRGLIQFWNLSPVIIYEISVREIDDDEWSENLITDVINPDDITTFPVKAGHYMLRIIDPNGFEYQQIQIEIIAGETEDLLFYG
ncbi:hypothetical protein ACFLYJ_01160 [Candidatus Cloacimonadota bacterium]